MPSATPKPSTSPLVASVGSQSVLNEIVGAEEKKTISGPDVQRRWRVGSIDHYLERTDLLSFTLELFLALVESVLALRDELYQGIHGLLCAVTFCPNGYLLVLLRSQGH